MSIFNVSALLATLTVCSKHGNRESQSRKQFQFHSYVFLVGAKMQKKSATHNMNFITCNLYGVNKRRFTSKKSIQI